MSEEHLHGDITEHKHKEYDYWHPATRVHSENTRDQLPAGHVLSKKPLAEKLILDLVGITPIQKMELGKSLEIGAVVSLTEGLEHHRYAASTILSDSFKDFDNGSSAHYGALFYAEWQPNHNSITHRYLIEVSGEDVYVGYFPWDGRKPRLYGIHHKKQDVIKFLHKTHSATLQLPELTLLTELNIPNISFHNHDRMSTRIIADRRHRLNIPNISFHNHDPDGVDKMFVTHKQGTFYTRSIYGEFTPLQDCKFTPDGVTETSGKWNDDEVDSTGMNLGNPRHPYYMFQGATGYVELYEGKMFCYPDGSIRFLTPEDEKTVFRDFTDLQVVQGDLIAYDVELPDPQKRDLKPFEGINIDRHEIRADKECLLRYEEKYFVVDDCILTITHPEHGETKHEARKGVMLALLLGTSRPFQKDTGRD